MRKNPSASSPRHEDARINAPSALFISTFGEKFRRRSPENVLSEIRQRYSEGYRVFDFEDDNLSFSKEDLKAILNALIAEFPGKDLRLVAMNGISYLSLDREILELMKKAGFRNLNISLVSANADVLARLKRPHTLNKYLDVVNQAHELGFDIVSYQILGIPYESSGGHDRHHGPDGLSAGPHRGVHLLPDSRLPDRAGVP